MTSAASAATVAEFSADSPDILAAASPVSAGPAAVAVPGADSRGSCRLSTVGDAGDSDARLDDCRAGSAVAEDLEPCLEGLPDEVDSLVGRRGADSLEDLRKSMFR